jgi:hypothetical protein
VEELDGTMGWKSEGVWVELSTCEVCSEFEWSLTMWHIPYLLQNVSMGYSSNPSNKIETNTDFLPNIINRAYRDYSSRFWGSCRGQSG